MGDHVGPRSEAHTHSFVQGCVRDDLEPPRVRSSHECIEHVLGGTGQIGDDLDVIHPVCHLHLDEPLRLVGGIDQRDVRIGRNAAVRAALRCRRHAGGAEVSDSPQSPQRLEL